MSTPAAGARLSWLLALAALFGVAAVCWGFLYLSASAMSRMAGTPALLSLARVMMSPGDVGPYLAASALMWVAMMVAMMTPAVVPMMAVFRGLVREGNATLAACAFAGGYFACWSVFGLVAAVLQWWLHDRGVLHGMGLATAPRMGGMLLVAAGLYQLTPLKSACLSHCRGPLGFFLEHWRAGLAGAFRMGARHGVYCLGCCWVLMLLMFAGGAMSVPTMAALSAFILAERLLPAGPWVARAPGVLLVLLGLGLWFGVSGR